MYIFVNSTTLIRSITVNGFYFTLDDSLTIS